LDEGWAAAVWHKASEMPVCTAMALTSRLCACHPRLSPCSSQADGLLPKWLAFTLTQQPALFDRAFQRCFSKVCGGRKLVGPAWAWVVMLLCLH